MAKSPFLHYSGTPKFNDSHHAMKSMIHPAKEEQNMQIQSEVNTIQSETRLSVQTSSGSGRYNWWSFLSQPQKKSQRPTTPQVQQDTPQKKEKKKVRKKDIFF
ncbi:hypothetical protein Ancab_031509 [Ancistrocladus abbreviatus]